MRCLAVIEIVLLVALAVAHGCEPDNRRICGSVYCDHTGGPLNNCRIGVTGGWCPNADNYVTQTDANGCYSFRADSLPGNKFWLFVDSGDEDHGNIMHVDVKLNELPRLVGGDDWLRAPDTNLPWHGEFCTKIGRHWFDKDYLDELARDIGAG